MNYPDKEFPQISRVNSLRRRSTLLDLCPEDLRLLRFSTNKFVLLKIGRNKERFYRLLPVLIISRLLYFHGHQSPIYGQLGSAAVVDGERN